MDYEYLWNKLKECLEGGKESLERQKELFTLMGDTMNRARVKGEILSFEFIQELMTELETD